MQQSEKLCSSFSSAGNINYFDAITSRVVLKIIVYNLNLSNQICFQAGAVCFTIEDFEHPDILIIYLSSKKPSIPVERWPRKWYELMKSEINNKQEKFKRT